jgi:hypothetical protein
MRRAAARAPPADPISAGDAGPAVVKPRALSGNREDACQAQATDYGKKVENAE